MDRPEPLTLQWRKASRSGSTGECIETARSSDIVLVRDSKDPDGPRLGFDRAAWRAFTQRIKGTE
ncbi:DUF397 domain-containing protein [Actinomadura barringtoniae]|uniref:DUF397 domain-containing protein n=1 Tax=Actinomadura barringtoniae TaxID=1427535 RepID=A0A939PF47_9ACTN|nr:DUF397 domain-containing protein [Actinomadura barringtoniae]MBO2451515.1 DUF397 domain-containing protein [Actinomadura barringtoniae]